MRSQVQADLDSMIRESLQETLIANMPGSTGPRFLRGDPNFRAIAQADCITDAVWYSYRVMEAHGIDDTSLPADAIAQVIDDWRV